MIRRIFMQAIGLSLFSPTIANDSKVTKYLDKNLIIISEAEMEQIRINADLLFIPRCRIDNKNSLLSEMKSFVDMAKKHNVQLETNVYGNINNGGVSIISYDESNKHRHPRGYIEALAILIKNAAFTGCGHEV